MKNGLWITCMYIICAAQVVQLHASSQNTEELPEEVGCNAEHIYVVAAM